MKTDLPDAGAGSRLSIHDTELALRRLSRMRRLLEQLLTTAITLDGLNLSPAPAVKEKAAAPSPAASR